MSQAKTQFERVTRAFKKVLNNQNRDPVEYEDDVWNFFQNCWHLKDWIKNDVQGVAKATRQKIEVEVKGHPALVTIGELTKKSKHLELTRSLKASRETPRAQTRRGATAYIDRRDQVKPTAETGDSIYFVVTDENGDELAVKKLATDAMKNWMAIIKN